MENWFEWLLRNSKAVCGKTPGYFTNRWRMIAGFTLHCNWNCLNVTWIYPWTSLLTCCAQSVASDQARQWSQSHPQTFKTFLIMGLFSKWIPAHWSEEYIYIIMSHWLVGKKNLLTQSQRFCGGSSCVKHFKVLLRWLSFQIVTDVFWPLCPTVIPTKSELVVATWPIDTPYAFQLVHGSHLEYEHEALKGR